MRNWMMAILPLALVTGCNGTAPGDQKQGEQNEARPPAQVGPIVSQSYALAGFTGVEVSGPIPLPTDKKVVTILRAVHKYKDSREQFERRTHKRLIDVIKPTQKTVEALTSLDLPAGVDIEIKL